MLTAIQLSLAVGAIAALVGCPALYQFTNTWSQKITGVTLADGGRPRTIGLIVHGLVAALLTYALLHQTAPAPVYLPPVTI